MYVLKLRKRDVKTTKHYTWVETGHIKKSSLLSFCFLVARNYIWKCRANENKPTFKAYIFLPEKYYQLESFQNENLRNEIKVVFPSFKL